MRKHLMHRIWNKPTVSNKPFYLIVFTFTGIGRDNQRCTPGNHQVGTALRERNGFHCQVNSYRLFRSFSYQDNSIYHMSQAFSFAY